MTAEERPVIGITTRIELETDRFYLSRHYSEAVEAAGGVPSRRGGRQRAARRIELERAYLLVLRDGAPPLLVWRASVPEVQSG